MEHTSPSGLRDWSTRGKLEMKHQSAPPGGRGLETCVTCVTVQDEEAEEMEGRHMGRKHEPFID